jgi:RNA polymerase sigma-70 factor (ECF subfamily)
VGVENVHELRRTRSEAAVLPRLDAAYRVALFLARHEVDAEDLVQEACLRTYRGFGR